MNPRRPRHTAQHRAGQPGSRSLADILAAHDPTTTGQQPSGLKPPARLIRSRHGSKLDEDLRTPTTRAAAAQLGVDPATLEGLDVFDAASLVRGRAHEGITRLYQCRPTLRRARRTLELTWDTSHLISAVTTRVVAVQVAETQLVTALDKLEAAATYARTARAEQAQFYPYGGHLVATPPTHQLMADRLALADNIADAAHTLARRAVRVLLRETARAELFAADLDRHINEALDHASAAAAAADGAAPPPVLRLVQAILPAQAGHDWWREVCALYAEATPAERRAAQRSYLAGAPATIWTLWALARYQNAAGQAAAEHDDPATHSPQQSDSDTSR